MTPEPQAPKEYIITMGRIIKVRNMLMVDGYHNADVLDRMVNLLRSRPHQAPARTAEHMQSAYAHGVMDGERKAREDVLDILEPMIRDYWETPYSDDPCSIEQILDKIESLRSTQQQAGDP